MISIIICARRPDISSELKENIKNTIGVNYELVIIDNSSNGYSIFQAYNKGVSLSKYPFLLFMHDDILYHTADWGLKIIEHFENEKIGAVGIAGTPYLSHFPGSWWSSYLGFLYLLQSDTPGAKPELHDFSPSITNSRKCVALDGVWFCIRKSLFDFIHFDETNFSGFHFYDIDITLQVYKQGFQLLCIKDILIHHQSIGVLNKEWINNLFIFQKKWSDELPVSCIQMSFTKRMEFEYRTLDTFTSDQLRILGSSKKMRSRIYTFAIKKMLTYPSSFLYIKFPIWLAKFSFRYIKNLLSK